jgi:hypothetical protein
MGDGSRRKLIMQRDNYVCFETRSHYFFSPHRFDLSGNFAPQATERLPLVFK